MSIFENLRPNSSVRDISSTDVPKTTRRFFGSRNSQWGLSRSNDQANSVTHLQDLHGTYKAKTENETMERSDPEGFDPLSSSHLPGTVSRINPLMRMSSIEIDRCFNYDEDVSLSRSNSINSNQSMRKTKLSEFPKNHYWFKSQKEREEDVFETRAETIPGSNIRCSSDNKVYYAEEDISYS